ncbi:hypothetical protein [Kitasatospora sp. NRRL B-11411]|uniref:hypothetical protein n=1 Tax=Kitasatospora sp. NRRL B-11411 TaxID=1463822 RepID=UPI0004C2EF7A|nr:hypothetical protein [Kitasatospora sp. NRRL B-11411]
MDGARRERLRAAAIRWAVLVIGLVVLLSGVGYAMPGWAVAHGAGDRGVFTVTREAVDCGRCVVEGTFTPDDPARPALTRANVMGHLPAARLGEQSPAVGYQGAVYPPGGDGAWQRGAALAGAGLAALLLWTWLVLRHRRPSPATTRPDA